MTASGVSPSSSPRLPSPPPFTEVQIGPQSPSVGESFGKDAEQFLGGTGSEDDGSTRRIRPGTKAADMAFGPPLIPLSQLDSPFQLQEHLKALYHHFTKPEGSADVVPITRQVALQLAEPPEGVDRSLWLYELCRFLTMKVNNLIIAFFAEDPPCSSQTCPEMRASEWQYLCAVHDPPKSCCAIDYCCHTLDWATNTLTSPKYFPSRLTLGSEAAGGPQASMRHLTNIFRRLYRIFAHAWFQHRDVFWEVEGHDGLYVFFKTVCDLFKLIPPDGYTIPPEAEGLDALQTKADEPAEDKRLSTLRKENEDPFSGGMDSMDAGMNTGATTRRHKHSPSTGSRVTTITESAEDVEEVPQQSAPLREVLHESPEPQPQVETPTEDGSKESQQGLSESTELNASTRAADSTDSPTEVSEQAQQPADPQADPESEKPGQSEDSEKAEAQEGDSKAEEPAKASEDDNVTSTGEKDAKESQESQPEAKTES